MEALDWIELPESFYQALADIINGVFKGGAIPHAWLRVRVVSIPKEGGGQRGQRAGLQC